MLGNNSKIISMHMNIFAQMPFVVNETSAGGHQGLEQ